MYDTICQYIEREMKFREIETRLCETSDSASLQSLYNHCIQCSIIVIFILRFAFFVKRHINLHGLFNA